MRTVLAFSAAVLLLASPPPATAATFTFQAPTGDACLPSLNSATPISGQGTCSQAFFADGTENRDVAWRADFTSLGLYYSYDVSGIAGAAPWQVDAHTTGFATVTVVDMLTITGGAGDGVLRVGIGVHGVDSVLGGPFSTFVQSAINTNAGPNSFQGPGSFIVDVPFTYGAAFSVERSLNVGILHLAFGNDNTGAWGPYGATADYLHSADFSFAVLDAQLAPVAGATIASDSGYYYPQGSVAVPEPTALTLLLLGCAGALARASRRRGA